MPPSALQAAVADVRWALAAAPTGLSAGLHLYSLSADGTLLLWGPLPQPLQDLFPSGSAGRGLRGGSGSTSWASPSSKLAAAVGSPLDVGAALASAVAAAAAVNATAEAASLLGGAARPTITAVSAQAPGAPMPTAAGGVEAGGHLVAVAVHGGGLAVLWVEPLAQGGTPGQASFRLLWSTSGSGSPVRWVKQADSCLACVMWLELVSLQARFVCSCHFSSACHNNNTQRKAHITP